MLLPKQFSTFRRGAGSAEQNIDYENMHYYLFIYELLLL